MRSQREDRHFAHRQNHDGTFDSICLVCFRTVDHEATEPDLDQPERDHVCAVEDKERFDEWRRKWSKFRPGQIPEAHGPQLRRSA